MVKVIIDRSELEESQWKGRIKKGIALLLLDIDCRYVMESDYGFMTEFRESKWFNPRMIKIIYSYKRRHIDIVIHYKETRFIKLLQTWAKVNLVNCTIKLVDYD